MKITEIAKLANVSPSTVSKIINGKDDAISSKTREKVLKIVKDYNYTPYGSSIESNSTKKFILAILLRDGLNASFMEGVLAASQKRGYSVLVFDSENSNETELKNITAICSNKVDGLIWEQVNSDSKKHVSIFDEKKIQYIPINDPLESDAYHIDFEFLAYKMTETMIDHQHSRIACFFQKNAWYANFFLEGYKQCLFDHKLSFKDDLILFENNFSYEKLKTNGATSIICSDYSLALTIQKELTKYNELLSDNFALLSLQNESCSELGSLPISSVKIDNKKFGTTVADQLINICEKAIVSRTAVRVRPAFEIGTSESLFFPVHLQSKKIVVLGSINNDLTFNVSSLPQAGETIKIAKSASALGGKGANQAVGVSRLGVTASLIGSVGKDLDSKLLLDELSKEKIQLAGVVRDTESNAGKAYIYIDKAGESAITVFPGANSTLNSSSIEQNAHLFKRASYCLLSTEVPLDAVLSAAAIAKENNVLNILKPATMDSLPEDLINLVDIFLPNEKEAYILSNKRGSAEKQAQYFLKKGFPCVIITMGDKGCYVLSADVKGYFKNPKTLVVDTTGGADAFISALAVSLLKGRNLEEAVKIALHAASFCVSRQGVTTALVDGNTLETIVNLNAV